MLQSENIKLEEELKQTAEQKTKLEVMEERQKADQAILTELNDKIKNMSLN